VTTFLLTPCSDDGVSDEFAGPYEASAECEQLEYFWNQFIIRPNQCFELFMLLATLIFTRYKALGGKKTFKDAAWMITDVASNCLFGVIFDPMAPGHTEAWEAFNANPAMTRDDFWLMLGAPSPPAPRAAPVPAVVPPSPGEP